MYECVRCGVTTTHLTITAGNTGPICRHCLELYAVNPAGWKKNWVDKTKQRSFYGAISMSGHTQAGSFRRLIPLGIKTQTIREPMIHGRAHVIVGIPTKLYWNMRRVTKGEKAELIATVTPTAYEEVTLLDMWWDEENAKADGFKDLEEFREWFYPEGLPPWDSLPEMFREAAKATTEFKSVDKILFNSSIRAGKATMIRVLTEMQKPLRRIKWSSPVTE